MPRRALASPESNSGLVLSCLIHAVAGRTFPAGERGSAAGSLLSSHYPNYTWACVLCRPSPESRSKLPFHLVWFLGWLTWHLALGPSSVLYLQHKLCSYFDALQQLIVWGGRRLCGGARAACVQLVLSNTRRGWVAGRTLPTGERSSAAGSLQLARCSPPTPTTLNILGSACCAGHHPSCPFTLSGSSVGQRQRGILRSIHLLSCTCNTSYVRILMLFDIFLHPSRSPASSCHSGTSRSLSHGFTRRASLRSTASSATTAAASNVNSSVSCPTQLPLSRVWYICACVCLYSACAY
jgi:hypothetical protein